MSLLDPVNVLDLLGVNAHDSRYWRYSQSDL